MTAPPPTYPTPAQQGQGEEPRYPVGEGVAATGWRGQYAIPLEYGLGPLNMSYTTRRMPDASDIAGMDSDQVRDVLRHASALASTHESWYTRTWQGPYNKMRKQLHARLGQLSMPSRPGEK